MQIKTKIKNKLEAAFAPERLEVIDESHLHHGHSGARPEGETHFRVHITAACFTSMSRLERQRAVMEVLADELQEPVHALAIKAHGLY